MANELIRPIDADTAHAIEEASKAMGKAIEVAMQTGKYVGAVLGDLPHDLVGIIGDWVAHQRARRWIELQADTEKILRDRGVENRETVSPSVAIPLIAAAINEDRDGLKQLWAKLLATAMDPSRANRVRAAFIEALKKMEPLDAAVLPYVHQHGGRVDGGVANTLAAELRATRDEIDVSVANLVKLELLGPTQHPSAAITASGREFLRAIGDT